MHTSDLLCVTFRSPPSLAGLDSTSTVSSMPLSQSSPATDLRTSSQDGATESTRGLSFQCFHSTGMRCIRYHFFGGRYWEDLTHSITYFHKISALVVVQTRCER